MRILIEIISGMRMTSKHTTDHIAFRIEKKTFNAIYQSTDDSQADIVNFFPFSGEHNIYRAMLGILIKVCYKFFFLFYTTTIAINAKRIFLRF